MFEVPHVSANYFDIKRSRIFSLSTRKGATSRTSASITKASVIGQVGTLLGDYGVNIGEWRLGRVRKGEDALSFINLDNEPSKEAITALEKVSAVKKLKIIRL